MVYAVEATAANVHDVDIDEKLILQNGAVVYGDSGYLDLPNSLNFKRMGMSPELNASSTQPLSDQNSRHPTQPSVPLISAQGAIRCTAASIDILP